MSETQNPGGETGRFTVRVQAETHFAWLRTRLAVERTIMALVRTAVSLIGFGFTIVQFFDRMQQMPGTAPALYPNAAVYLGLALIFCGIASLVIALWEYNWTLRYLWSKDYQPVAGMEKERHRSPTVGIILVLLVVGLYAFFSIVIRFM